MRWHNWVNLKLAGGETADVGDIVRTIDVGYTAFGRLHRDDLLVNHIQPGDLIVGFASYGQSTYENSYNGGMGSNGLTSARHDVFDHSYAGKYPASFDPSLPDDVVYVGSKKLTDTIDIDGQAIPVGKLVLSPTRTYLPVIKQLFEQLRPHLHGMIHCTGGGQTKVVKCIENVKVIKDNFLPIPPLFELIQQEAGTGWKEMYQVFNMGHRLEVYLPEAQAKDAIAIGKAFGIDAQIVGRVEAAPEATVEVHSPHGIFTYNE